jgi:hypothetical protein
MENADPSAQLPGRRRSRFGLADVNVMVRGEGQRQGRARGRGRAGNVAADTHAAVFDTLPFVRTRRQTRRPPPPLTRSCWDP